MQRLIAKSQVGVNYVWVTCGNARADKETTATSYRARDSVTGYAALHDTVTSRHTGPGPRGIFPAKTHDDGSDKLASFLAPHIRANSRKYLARWRQFPVLFQSDKL